MKKTWNLLCKIVCYAAVVFVFIIPVLRLAIMSITQKIGYGFENYATLFQEPRTLRAIGNTILIAVASTAISTLLGVLFAFLIAYTNIKRKRLMELLVLAPFIIPSYIITISWSSFLEKRGVVNQFLQLLCLPAINIYSLFGIILVLGICNVPAVYLITVNMFRKIPKELEWASRASGYSQLETFVRINLVQSLPAIIGGSALAFLASIDNFAVPAFLGIPSSIPVLSTYIYEKVIGFGPDSFYSASALSILLSAVAIIGIAIMNAFVQKSRHAESIREDWSVRVILNHSSRRVVEWIFVTFLAVLNFVPLMTMTASSFLKTYGTQFSFDNFSIKNYQFIFSNYGVMQSIFNSILLAFITSVACILIGTAVAYVKVRKGGCAVNLLESCASLTYAIPGIVLALAMIFHWSMVPNVYGTIVILIIAYITRYLILQIKGSTTAVLSVHPSMEEAARVSGSGKVRMWRWILTPLLFRQVISSSFLIFVSSMTEMTLSSLLAAADTKTIGLTIFNLQQSGDYNLSYALSVVVVALILGGYGFSLLIRQKPVKDKGGVASYPQKIAIAPSVELRQNSLERMIS